MMIIPGAFRFGDDYFVMMVFSVSVDCQTPVADGGLVG